MKQSILETIGETPLVHLRKLLPAARFDLFGKIEALNPGGSIKDRPAREILTEALVSGAVGPQTVIVESSSGNMGIGIAQVCRYLGLKFICVVDSKTTAQNIRILRAYGAEVDVVSEPDPETGELLQARLTRVRELLREHGDSFWPNQYANESNSGAHYRTTMHEITTALQGKLDYLFVATSTCGTIRGCAEYARDHDLETKIIAVDSVGSLIFSTEPAPRSIPGLGAGMRPPLCDRSLIDEVVHVSDMDCVNGCRQLMAREAILAGGSSGGVLSAVSKLQDRIEAGSTCVAILADRGERYLDTVYNDEWVRNLVGMTALHSEEAKLVAA